MAWRLVVFGRPRLASARDEQMVERGEESRRGPWHRPSGRFANCGCPRRSPGSRDRRAESELAHRDCVRARLRRVRRDHRNKRQALRRKIASAAFCAPRFRRLVARLLRVARASPRPGILTAVLTTTGDLRPTAGARSNTIPATGRVPPLATLRRESARRVAVADHEDSVMRDSRAAPAAASPPRRRRRRPLPSPGSILWAEGFVQA